MKMNNLTDLYIDQLKDLHNAEKQLVQALPSMAKAATSADLKAGFTKHLEQTRTQVNRLDQIFSRHGITVGNKKCAAMEGLIKEGAEAMQIEGNENVRDAALIAAAQRVEHYEIAGYGTVRSYAKQLGHDNDLELLEMSLEEEEKTDQDLTKLAEGGILSSGINDKAMAGKANGSKSH